MARAGRTRSPVDEFTPREREVLSLMARGKSNRAIAEDLTLTKRAVEKHVGSIFMKLELDDEEVVSRRVAAVLMYLAGHRRPPARRVSPGWDSRRKSTCPPRVAVTLRLTCPRHGTRRSHHQFLTHRATS